MNKIIKTAPEEIAEKLGDFYQNGWNTLFNSGADWQQRVLEDIIYLAQDSLYAKEHGFAQIKTKAEFEAMVPVSDYSDYQPYIETNMKEDNHQLIGLATDYYLMTTGTATGQVKFFAETNIGALARQLSIDIWNMLLMKNVPQMGQPNMKMLAIVNCAPIDKAPNNLPVLRASGQAAKALWERAGELYVFPYEFLEAEMSDDDRLYLTALYSVKDVDFSLVFSNNPAYFNMILDQIAQKPQKIIDDIRHGYFSADLKETDRLLLTAQFSADEKRANELQKLFDDYGYLPIEQIWPKLVFVGTWLPGTAGRLAKDIIRRLPRNVQYISEGYGASEAMLNIPYEFSKPYGPIAAYAYYYEFLPLDGGKILSMTEVQDGEYYELLITTYSGLYRYNMHDIVQIQGFTGDTANITFCCKSSEVCHLSGKTIYGFVLTELIERAEKMLGILLSYFQFLVEDDQLSVVIQPYENDFRTETFGECLKIIAQEAGIILKHLYVVKKGYYNELFRRLALNGRSIQNIKLPLVVEEKPSAEWLQQIYHS